MVFSHPSSGTMKLIVSERSHDNNSEEKMNMGLMHTAKLVDQGRVLLVSLSDTHYIGALSIREHNDTLVLHIEASS